jgi:hypothetical protein
MSLCPSGLLMAALTLTIVMFDIYNNQFNYIFIHSILGSIISILFFTMCNYGLEMINWIVIGVIPIYILFTWIFKKKIEYIEDISEKDLYDQECCEIDSCKAPDEPKSCKQPSSYKKPSKYKNESLSCPVKPMRLGTQCGISRFT